MILKMDLHQNIRSVESVTYTLAMVSVVIFLACQVFYSRVCTMLGWLCG